jgi:glycosyltransferase involved in cell wall biosynthesis
MKTLIAVVAYNEQEAIATTLKDLLDHNWGYDIVVIDNGSSDGTARVAASMGIPVVKHCINTGGSAGVMTTYFLYACRNDYDCLCQFDGDGQHIASELPKICDPVRTVQADYVIGSRFLKKDGFQSTFTRRLGIRLFSMLDSLIVGQKVSDVTSGFRAYGRPVIEFFGRSYPFELHDTNQLLLASRFSGARILEVPVQMRARATGKSEFDLLAAFSYPLFGVINILGVWLQRHRISKTRR